MTEDSESMSPETGTAFVAVIITLVVTAIVLICLFQIVKHCMQRQARKKAAMQVSGSIDSRGQTEGVQHYSQNVSELSVERTESEMQYEETHELMGRNQCQELPGHELRRPRSSFRKHQGLWCEEYDRGLISSPSRQDMERYSFDEPDFGSLHESALTLHEFV